MHAYRTQEIFGGRKIGKIGNCELFAKTFFAIFIKINVFGIAMLQLIHQSFPLQ